MMRRHTGRLETGAMLTSLGKIALAGAILGAVCWSAQHFVFPDATRLPEWKRILDVLVTIALGGGAFFGDGLSPGYRRTARSGRALVRKALCLRRTRSADAVIVSGLFQVDAPNSYRRR